MKRSVFLFLSILLGVDLYAQIVSAPKINIQAKVDSILSKHSQAGGPGFSLAVVRNGQLIHSCRRGLANLNYDIPIGEETIFRVASLAKQFTAACVGVLVLHNKISLADDVRKYIPELPDYGKVITIRHLLNHTSGIRNHTVLEQLRGVQDGFEGLTNLQTNELIFKQKGINHVPGEKMLYSNSNYVLLALLVERVSGKSLNDFAAEQLFGPLGMKNTFYKKSNQEIIKNVAYAYYKEARGYQQANSLNLCVGAGGLLSTIGDLTRWSAIFTAKDSAFKALAGFLTTRDTLNDGTLSNYGRGVFVSEYKGHKTIHHSGMALGVRAQIITLPKEELSLIILANLENINAVDLSYQVLDLFIKPLSHSAKKEKAYVHKRKELETFTGDYQELNSDLTIRILLENDTLKAKNRMGKLAIPLVAKSRYNFGRANNASVTHTFTTYTNKPPDMAVDFAGATFYFERVQLVEAASVQVMDYAGQYYSEEIGATYSLFVENNGLYVSYPYHDKIKLTPGQKDEFGSGDRTRYIFKRNSANEVTSFTIASEGTVKDILFEKLREKHK